MIKNNLKEHYDLWIEEGWKHYTFNDKKITSTEKDNTLPFYFVIPQGKNKEGEYALSVQGQDIEFRQGFISNINTIILDPSNFVDNTYKGLSNITKLLISDNGKKISLELSETKSLFKKILKYIKDGVYLGKANEGVGKKKTKESELKEYNRIWNEINNPIRTSIKDFPLTLMSDEIEDLDEKLLPANKKKKDLTDLIKSKRQTLKLSLKSLKDTFDFDEDIYTELQTELSNRYSYPYTKTLTTEILNILLDPYYKKLKINTKKKKDIDLTELLKSKGGYLMEEDLGDKQIKVAGKIEKWTTANIKKKETEWWLTNDVSKQGTLYLPYYYARNNFDPDKPEEFFIKIKKNERGHDDIDETKGIFISPPGIGKSLRNISCICKGGQRNVLLVVHAQKLAENTFANHDKEGFLQQNPITRESYKCPYHGVVHGKYEAKLNDLTQWWNDEEKKLEGVAGVSILYYPYFLGYMARNMMSDDDIKTILKGFTNDGKTRMSSDYERISRGLKNSRKKMLPPGAIIFFDEEDTTEVIEYKTVLKESAIYKKDGEQMINSIFMSATHEGREIPLTSAFDMDSRETAPMSKDMDFKKFSDADKKYFDYDEKLANEKSLLFLPDFKDIPKEKLKDIPLVIFEEAIMGDAIIINSSLPKGGLMISDDSMRRGYNWDIDDLFDCGMEKIKDLLLSPNEIKIVETIREYTLANSIQGKGRTARSKPGWTRTISSVFSTSSFSNSPIVKLILALFGKPKPLMDAYKVSWGRKTKEQVINIIRTAFALDGENDKWGVEPSAMFIGLKPNTMDIYGCFQQWETNFRGKEIEETLLNKYMKNYTPPKINDPVLAENTLMMIINSKIDKINDISKKFKLEIKTPLINYSNWTSSNLSAKIKKVKSILNLIIFNRLKKIDIYEENKFEYTEDQEKKFDKIVNYYKVVNNASVSINSPHDPKLSTIKIEYN